MSIRVHQQIGGISTRRHRRWSVPAKEPVYTTTLLGEGAHGTVHLVLALGEDGPEPRVIVKCAKNEEKAMTILRHEMEVLEYLGRALQAEDRARIVTLAQAPPGFHVQGMPHFYMEFANGKSLLAVLETCPGHRAPPALALTLASHLVAGLHAMHQVRVVHGDVKPDNIIVTQDAGNVVVKLIDFGLAVHRKDCPPPTVGAKPNHVRDDVPKGTPLYMSFQHLMRHHDPYRSDMHAMGATLYHACMGAILDGDCETFTDLMKIRYRRDIVDITEIAKHYANTALHAIIVNCLRHDEAVRWTTADILAAWK